MYITSDVDSPAENIIYEYDISCAETITCSEPTSDKVVLGIAESQVELSKRAIKHVTLPVIHRMEWLKRHDQKDNLTSQNIKFNFSNEMLASVANVVKASNKAGDWPRSVVQVIQTSEPTQPYRPVIICPFLVQDGEVHGCGLSTEDVDGGSIKFKWVPPDDDGGTEVKGYQIIYAAFDSLKKTSGTWKVPLQWPPINDKSFQLFLYLAPG